VRSFYAFHSGLVRPTVAAMRAASKQRFSTVGLCQQIALLAGATISFVNLACGTEMASPRLEPSFAADPDQTLASDSGALQIAVRFSPRPPSVGEDAAELSFTDAGGAPVTGLGLTVVPWMPAHGHGTSVNPTVTETEAGTFIASPLYLFMPGSWELRMTTTGTLDDTATAAFEIP
jgi:YtkA-like